MPVSKWRSIIDADVTGNYPVQIKSVDVILGESRR
jgi:hypothetical protein